MSQQQPLSSETFTVSHPPSKQVTDLRHALAGTDPAGFGRWDQIFEDRDWSSLQQAALAARHVLPICDRLPTVHDVHRVAQKVKIPLCAEWLVELHALLNSQCKAVQSSFLSEHSNTLQVRDLVEWLYCTNRICEHMEKLATKQQLSHLFGDAGMLTRDVANAFDDLYETLQPAASFYRNVPWAALTSFEELAAVGRLIQFIGPLHYFHVELYFSSRLHLIEKNRALEHGGVHRWWTASANRKSLHTGLTTFSSINALQERVQQLTNFLVAFDAENPDFCRAISLLESTLPGEAPILPQLELVRRLIVTMRDTFAAAHAEALTFVPTLLNAPYQLRRKRGVMRSLHRSEQLVSA